MRDQTNEERGKKTKIKENWRDGEEENRKKRADEKTLRHRRTRRDYRRRNGKAKRTLKRTRPIHLPSGPFITSPLPFRSDYSLNKPNGASLKPN